MLKLKYILAGVSVIFVIIVCVLRNNGPKVSKSGILHVSEVIKIADLSYSQANTYLSKERGFVATRDTVVNGVPVSFFDKKSDKIHEFLSKTEFQDGEANFSTVHYDLSLQQYADTFALALEKLGYQKKTVELGKVYSSWVYQKGPYTAVIGKTSSKEANASIFLKKARGR
ncbi:MAG: hypothetical protein V4687_03230 [Bacteroidota bacterium]